MILRFQGQPDAGPQSSKDITIKNGPTGGLIINFSGKTLERIQALAEAAGMPVQEWLNNVFQKELRKVITDALIIAKKGKHSAILKEAAETLIARHEREVL